MFNIIVDFNISKKIVVKKLGIVIRKMTKKEKALILKKVDDIFLKNKKLIFDSVDKYSEEEDLNLSLDLMKYGDSVRRIVMCCFYGLKKGFNVNTIDEINDLLNRTLIISYDKNILCKYIDENQFEKFISNLLSLYDIYSEEINFNKSVRNDYSYILKYNLLDLNIDNYDDKLITDLIFRYGDNKVMKNYVSLSEKYLSQISEFLDNLSEEEIRRFLFCLDLLYSSITMTQSSIVNYATIIESILINEGESIEQNFVLKTGMILKKYLPFKSRNDVLKDMLKYSYDIRSCIVHGNETKIIVVYNKIKQKKGALAELLKDSNGDYKSKKDDALRIADIILILCVRCVFKYWIEYSSEVNYLKNN